jgi:hypothetical protein
MVANIKLGPEGGPFVELDEDTGDFIIRVPNDSVDFDLSELSNISNLIANSAEIDGNTSPYAQDPHDVGGAQHAADTLANLNSKVSDATLDDTNDTREPEAHSGTHESGGTDEVNVAGLPGELADPQPSQTQDDGTDVVASLTLNFGSNVTVSDDAGTAKVDVDLSSVSSNAPDWAQDSNSPHNLSTDGNQYTLASTYDEIQLRFQSNTTFSSGGANIILNGDSGANYSITTLDGTFLSGEDKVEVQGNPAALSQSIEITGRWSSSAGLFNQSRNPTGTIAQSARNTNITSPLDTFSIVDGNGDPLTEDIDVEVYGRDIA